MQKALTSFEIWAERLGALPRNNKLAVARTLADAAREPVAQAEAAYSDHCKLLVQQGLIFDARSHALESALLAAKVRAREAAAAEHRAKAEGAPAIEKHLLRFQDEGLDALRKALNEAREIAKMLAAVSQRATLEGANPNVKISKAKRINADLAAMLARLK